MLLVGRSGGTGLHLDLRRVWLGVEACNPFVIINSAISRLIIRLKDCGGLFRTLQNHADLGHSAAKLIQCDASSVLDVEEAERLYHEGVPVLGWRAFLLEFAY